MTVRQAELLMTIATILASLGLMWSATDGLAIGWVPEKGPGSGYWPFWLSFGMLLCAIATLVRWFTRASPESRSNEPFIAVGAGTVVATTAGALLVLLIAIHLVGIYIALFLFLLFYLKFLGRHDWPITIFLVGGIPIGIFALFEWALQIPLPKAITEEWFYPVFEIMYGTNYFWMCIVGSFAILGAVSLTLHKLSQNG